MRAGNSQVLSVCLHNNAAKTVTCQVFTGFARVYFLNGNIMDLIAYVYQTSSDFGFCAYFQQRKMKNMSTKFDHASMVLARILALQMAIKRQRSRPTRWLRTKSRVFWPYWSARQSTAAKP
jgi:hypothetical protein